jgi:hypothetical protein
MTCDPATSKNKQTKQSASQISANHYPATSKKVGRVFHNKNLGMQWGVSTSFRDFVNAGKD